MANRRLLRQTGSGVAALLLVILPPSAGAQRAVEDGRSPPAGTGSVCLVATAEPTSGGKSLYNYTAGIPWPAYTVQFNAGVAVDLPHAPKGRGPGMLVTGLPLHQSHMVRIRHQGKPIESFRFRFDKADRGRLCIFVNELYMTWNLWSAHQRPACNCKNARSTPWQEPSDRPPGGSR